MTRLALLIAALSLIASAAVAADPPADAPKPPPPNARLGMNLSGPADWNTELPFVDVFRMARPWISQRKGQPWGKGPPLDLDEHGWVKRLEADCSAETPLCTIEHGYYPGGEYTVLYEGQGRLEFTNAEIMSSEPGRMVIRPNPLRGGFFLRIAETKPDDYVRRIRVIMPGFEKTYATEPFDPIFLRRWQGVACLRFMDWMHTNGSKISRWSERPTPAGATFSGKGVAVEVMVDLANRLKADAWFCMPHLADDDYVRQFARVVKERLDPKLKVWIEMSNEVWNSQFAQTRWSWEKAKELGIGPQERPWEGGGMFYAGRSVEMFRIWQEEFGGRERLVRVLAWQSGNTHWMRNIVLPYKDAWKETDALAIAPYVAMNVHREGKDLTADKVAAMSVDEAMDWLEKTSLPRSIKMIRDSKQVADDYGLRLVAYEAGQHMVGVGDATNNDQLTALFHKCNASPRMGKIYDAYLAAWKDSGGDLLCNFSSVGRWSKWGSWGVIQFYNDDPAGSPKLMSLMRWAKSCGQPLEVPSSEPSP
jgi:hypothetical protein